MALAASKRIRLLLASRLRPVLLVLVVVFIVLEIVFLSPSSVEENQQNQTLAAESIVEVPTEALAPGIPKGVPEYSVDQFSYVSTHNGQKEWKILSTQALLYNKDRLVHARTVTAYLYDSSGRPTVVTGKEAKYLMNQKDLEVFGDVRTEFPDGFRTQSEYLRYHPDTRKIEIPSQYGVQGQGRQENGQDFEFTSNGLDYLMDSARIVLPRNVNFTMIKPPDANQAQSGGVQERTRIISDHCVIQRDKQMAYFTMDESRPLETRFVQISQPTLFVRARTANSNYGDFSKVLKYLVAHDDVLVKEKPAEGKQSSGLRYGTAGKAEFDTHRNVIVMTGYPQVYQGNDTMTGDIIILHRDTDIVEVEHSNAYSTGEQRPSGQDTQSRGAPKELQGTAGR